MKKSMIAPTLALLALASLRGFADDKPKSSFKGEASELLGAYTVVSGERFGQKEPEERIKGTMVRFTEDSVIVLDKDKKEAYASTFKLDSSKSPCVITMKSKLAPSEGEVAKGLIDKDGDTVKLIYAIPGGEMPTEFKTKARQMMFIMKKEKK